MQKIKSFFKFFHSLEISWQIYSIVILYLLIMLSAFYIKWQFGLMLLFLLVIVIIFIIFNFQDVADNINVLANNISKSAQTVQEDAMFRAPIAITIYDDQQRIKWINPTFQHLFMGQDLLGEYLISLNSDFKKVLAVKDDDQWHQVKFMDSYFKVLHREINHTLYLVDITEEIQIKENRKFDQVVFGYLFIDDYNEVLEAMDDRQVAKFDSDLLSEITRWTKLHGIYYKRLDEEKFIVIMNMRTLDSLEENKFKFFEELRKRNYAKNIPISISLGIAYSENEIYDINGLAEQAQNNLDLALGRGGDQIVVRSQDGRARFYGGKTNPSEKRSNIRSKLVFQALRNAISKADRVLVSGHKRPDTDSIGSAFGIYKLARHLNKEARIIINPMEINSDIEQLLSLPNEEYQLENVLISHEQTKDWITPSTLIIMVDHHRPSLSEAEDFLENHALIIIDHHRRGEEFPKNTELSYIEIYASSAAELITEFYMNMRNTSHNLNAFEATALLSGIVVDTNNFSARTGSRTFDAASFLKSRGADIAKINRILKEDLDAVINRNKLVDNLEIYDSDYAISKGPENQVIDNVIASQSADQMLTIKGVEASFVIYKRQSLEEDQSVIGISARSLGTINVQTIMERLGGGGHLSNAATQIYDKTMDEVYQMLIESIEFDREESE
ncbi:DHH family phosphoesterase [Eremococcus coleocola]|uniref:Cyclic-di-AMP phosphodiesterase n=1 Tax=Eremococcus coleocola ACS-139-V-Col8 TaxID=908337 RepID=E4KMD6_9LACT|nr:DHH family phosphoesterase [Eremococcus coleocola]EFR31890.1 DHHA1 domain protein [Eremococcus coleocola ACS-139-V-Col8]